MWEPQPRPSNLPPPIEWNDMADAPKDGSWIMLDVEDGSTDCYDYAASCVYVGRWNPKNFPDLGTYEWEVIERYPDSVFAEGEVTNWWSEGRVSGWLPLPKQ